MKSYLARFTVADELPKNFQETLAVEPSKPSKPLGKFRGNLQSEPSKPSKLAFDGFDGSAQKDFQNISHSEQPGICPKCHASTRLQHREPETYWCPGCRLFSGCDGRLMNLPATLKPITFELREAQQLVSDLLANGCTITVTGSDVAIGNLSKMSQQLWARIENAGSEFLQVAREMAEEFENERASQWKH